MSTGISPSLQAHPPSDIVVIGAGPAGLAVGACLSRVGASCTILEQGVDVGSSWRRHYDRLHLHTVKQHSGLPFLPFPRGSQRYPSRLDVISYLETYARHFKLNIRYGEEVRSARREGGTWTIVTGQSGYKAASLVVATGHSRAPHIPTWSGRGSYTGATLHSSEYRSGTSFRNQRVLVVGFGNSGGEIALDLHEHGAQPSLSVRSPVNVVPRELFGVSILTVAILQQRLPPWVADTLSRPILRLVLGDLSRLGLRQARYGPATQMTRNARIPLIDVGTIDLIRQGSIPVFPGIERFTEQGVAFVDGRVGQFDAVILATGYRPAVHAFLEGASATHDAEGTPLSSGAETALAGLYFCGLHVSATGMLREIGMEAQRLARIISRKGGAGSSR